MNDRDIIQQRIRGHSVRAIAKAQGCSVPGSSSHRHLLAYLNPDTSGRGSTSRRVVVFAAALGHKLVNEPLDSIRRGLPTAAAWTNRASRTFVR